MNIDIDRLRRDIENDLQGAFFAGGFGGAIIEENEVHRMSDSEIISYAKRHGINLSEYEY